MSEYDRYTIARESTEHPLQTVVIFSVPYVVTAEIFRQLVHVQADVNFEVGQQNEPLINENYLPTLEEGEQS